MGLTDRFKTISSLYEVAIDNNLQFRILQEEPYLLKDYLIPNEYNWLAPIEAKSFGYFCFATGDGQLQKHTLDRIIRHSKDDALYVYGNSSYGIPNIRSNFSTLFSMSSELSGFVNTKLKSLSTFVTVSFRFVNLLGESNEDVNGYKELPLDEQSALMQSCVEKLIGLKQAAGGVNVLVTTDSGKFLNYLDTLSIHGVSHLDGDSFHQHIGFSTEVSCKAMLKSFAEFILIGKSSCAYQIKVGPMHISNFPKHAATIGGVPYRLLEYPCSI